MDERLIGEMAADIKNISKAIERERIEAKESRERAAKRQESMEKHIQELQSRVANVEAEITEIKPTVASLDSVKKIGYGILIVVGSIGTVVGAILKDWFTGRLG